MKKLLLLVCLFAAVAASAQVDTLPGAGPRVTVSGGILEGVRLKSPAGVQAYLGVPYAAPPVGGLRWKAPAPAAPWSGVRPAKRFGPRAMQPPIFSDMVFRSDGMSENCLYLNVWLPEGRPAKPLPVLLYFYGGGFVAGDGSEPRYDGASMAAQGIIAITCNYRLGVFGFLAHPDLSKEGPGGGSGNWGLLDQAAALRWVHDNIKAFGGDPDRITIAGESAGSISVSAQLASPLSKHLVAGAIGESGSILGALPAVPQAGADSVGIQFAAAAGASSLDALRALPADSVLAAAGRFGHFRFPRSIDGHFFTEDPMTTYAAGRQAHVPLLVGWNSEEMTWRALPGMRTPTKAAFDSTVAALYGTKAPLIRKVYAAQSDADVERVATDLAGDRFIAFSTWRWSDVQARTGGRPVYRYYFAKPRPAPVAGGAPGTGATHSAEIEYALGNLPGNTVYAWTDEDRAVSRQLQGYFVHFVRNGNPNGPGLVAWPPVGKKGAASVLHINVRSQVRPDAHRGRYLTLQAVEGK